jgi:monoamine oxidase
MCVERGLSARDGLDLAAEIEARRASRRRFLADTGKLAVGVGAGLAGLVGRTERASAAPPPNSLSPNVAVVGAGLAGLMCANDLLDGGIRATVYEADSRVGGRCFSGRDLFPGQVFERGGELIDTGHKTMLGMCHRFGLDTELHFDFFDGEETFFFGGHHVDVEDIVDDYRVFVDAMRDDLRRLSSEVTAESFTAYDREIDETSLAEYLDGRGGAHPPIGPAGRAALAEAYLAEYGLEVDEQSALGFLFFAKASRQSKFKPFGTSDERYHIVQGNDRVTTGLRDDLQSGQLQQGMRLVKIRKPGASVELVFKQGNKTVTRTHDVAVIAIPFTLLRLVDLDASLDLDLRQREAIATLGYGTNAKTMIGFRGRPWGEAGSIGACLSDLPNVQLTWETNPSGATANQAILTDYGSGDRGAQLRVSALQTQVDGFLTDFDKVFPGAKARALKDSQGKYKAHLEHWPTNPFSLGSYTCYRPGQFTRLAGLEGRPTASLLFAGEHADAFYSYQGFMEGALLSGKAAAAEVLARVKKGTL